MRQKFLWLVCPVAVLFSSCGGSSAGKTGTGVTETVNNTACIAAYAEKMDQWMTPELAVEVAGLPAASMETKYNKRAKNSTYHELSYSWKNGRLSTDPQLAKYNAKVSDRLVLTGIRTTTIEKFQQSTRSVDPTDIEQANKTIDEVYDKNTHNAKIEAAKKKVSDAGVSNEEAKTTSKSITNAFKAVAAAYVKVDSIGQAAAWNTVERKLYVFQHKTEFHVLADLSNDNDVNKSKAIELARKLLTKCN